MYPNSNSNTTGSAVETSEISQELASIGNLLEELNSVFSGLEDKLSPLCCDPFPEATGSELKNPGRSSKHGRDLQDIESDIRNKIGRIRSLINRVQI